MRIPRFRNSDLIVSIMAKLTKKKFPDIPTEARTEPNYVVVINGHSGMPEISLIYFDRDRKLQFPSNGKPVSVREIKGRTISCSGIGKFEGILTPNKLTFNEEHTYEWVGMNPGRMVNGGRANHKREYILGRRGSFYAGRACVIGNSDLGPALAVNWVREMREKSFAYEFLAPSVVSLRRRIDEHRTEFPFSPLI